MSEVSKPTRNPVNRERQWVVVLRRPGAMAFVEGPYTLWKAREIAANPKWPDAAVGVYKLERVGDYET